MFVEQLTESDKREILFQALKILEKNHSNLQHECDNAHIEKVSNSDEVFFIYTFQSDLNIVGGGKCKNEKLYINDFLISVTCGSVKDGKLLEKMYYNFMCSKFPEYSTNYYNHFKKEIVDMYQRQLNELNEDIRISKSEKEKNYYNHYKNEIDEMYKKRIARLKQKINELSNLVNNDVNNEETR